MVVRGQGPAYDALTIIHLSVDDFVLPEDGFFDDFIKSQLLLSFVVLEWKCPGPCENTDVPRDLL